MRIQLEQNTGGWVNFRKSRIGASDVSVIMGVSPYRTALDLYHEKSTGEMREFSNSATMRGHVIEPIARRLFENEVNRNFPPAIFTHDQYDWLMASLDGYNEEINTLIEIKYQGREAHLSGKVPHHYMLQIQTQLMVSGAESATLVSYNPDVDPDYHTIHVERDAKMMNDILTAVIKFKNNLDDGIPPEPSDRDYVQIEEGTDVAHAISKYRLLLIEQKKIEALVELAKKEVSDLLDAANIRAARYHNVSVKRSTRKGAIDYNAVPALQGADLEAFRKPSTSYWTIVIR